MKNLAAQYYVLRMIILHCKNVLLWKKEKLISPFLAMER